METGNADDAPPPTSNVKNLQAALKGGRGGGVGSQLEGLWVEKGAEVQTTRIPKSPQEPWRKDKRAGMTRMATEM